MSGGFSFREEARRAMVHAIASVKAHENNLARRYLERVLSLPTSLDQKAEAYYWLSEISHTDAEKRENLILALSCDPGHHLARKKLAILDGKLRLEEIIDPDTFATEAPDSPQKSQGQRFECPHCGSRLIYSPDGQTLVCEHCEQEKRTLITKGIAETEFVLGISTALGHQKAQAVQSFECNACGAVYLLSPETLSLTCPHCDSVYANLKTQTRTLIPPDGIIPFKIDARKAYQQASDWIISNNPKIDSLNLSRLTGLYLPAWTFDIAGKLSWTGYISANDDTLIPVRNEGGIHLDDIFVAATSPVPPFFAEILAGFSPQDVKPYAAEYIAGWLAETYKLSMSDAAVEARSLAYQKAKAILIEQEHLKDIQKLQFYSDRMRLAAYKMVLVPVWLGGYTLYTERYPVTINGKTGQVFGDKPPSFLDKIADWLLEK